MSHLALARKWRPQRFEDVIGQRGVVETLKNAIATGRLAQSFIFAGPRGVGKTTTARILARALNCVKGPTAEPCGTCDACIEIADGRDMDVLEIDGATYTGVDAVREVIVEPLAIAPMRDRFKIFIIDEVHRLSKSAFDALLKSIEEPPPYVKFMMATTDLHSVPATIQSRSQVFELKTLPFSAIRDQLKTVTTREKVTDRRRGAGAGGAVGRRQHARRAVGARPDPRVHERSRHGRRRQHRARPHRPRLAVRDRRNRRARRCRRRLPRSPGVVVEAGFDLRIVCRELARLMRDLMVVKIDPARLTDPEIAAEGERDRLKALAEQYSREDLMRAFDLLSHAEYRHPRVVAAAASVRDGAGRSGSTSASSRRCPRSSAASRAAGPAGTLKAEGHRPKAQGEFRATGSPFRFSGSGRPQEVAEPKAQAPAGRSPDPGRRQNGPAIESGGRQDQLY